MECKLEHRCVKVYMPAEKDIPFFYELIDLMVYYKFNTVMIEVGGAMEYERHPEINEGWIEYCKKFTDYQGQSIDIQHSKTWAKNSIHMENGGGKFLSKKTVRGLIDYCRERGIRVIPEVPSLSHCDYLLTCHPELAERAEDDLPDTYCPSNPESYKLLFDVLDEVIEVFQPDTVQIGHDEFYSYGLCDKCKGKDPAQIYADDINKIYNYLAEKGIKTQMWGEKLLNAIKKNGVPVGGSERIVERNGVTQLIPATYKAIDLIPRDIIIDHWYWYQDENWEKQFHERGFAVIFSNFSGSHFENFYERCERGKIRGISISNWSLLNRDHMQRNKVLFNIAYSAKLLAGIAKPYKQTCIEVAEDLYAYRTRNIKRLLEFIHRTYIRLEHKPFVDGYMIDKEGDYLGKYVVTFEDGSTMEIPLYYNLNIGISKECSVNETSRDVETVTDMSDAQLFEPTYSCAIEDTDEGVFYRYGVAIPESAIVKEVKLCQDSKHGETISLKEYRVTERNL